jgi:hypothetical protein
MIERTVRLVVVVTMLLLAWAGVASAQGSTPEDAVMLDNTITDSGYLPGNRAGNFAYYRVQYPGSETPVSVRVTFSPGEAMYQKAFGFKVYGVNGFLLGESTPVRESGTQEVVIRDPLAVTALIVVHNYDWRTGAQYRISVSGLPEVTPTPRPAVRPTPPPVSPTPAVGLSGLGTAEDPFILPVDETLTGTLVGDRGGAFRFFALSPQVQDAVQIRLHVAPEYPGAGDAVGFTVYGPRGEVARGTRSATAGLRTARFIPRADEQYLIQVYNYVHGQSVDYRISYNQ